MDRYIDSDILLVAYMLTEGVKLLEIKEESPNQFVFILSDLNKCIRLKHEYLNDGKAPARTLFGVREMLINQIKSKKRSLS